MSLRLGELAPDFDLPSTNGGNVSLASLKGQSFVLYFYPRDFTPVCTKQACSFRDASARLRDLGVPVFGINKESLDTHRRFREKYSLPFELLSDEKGDVSKAYKARVPLIGLPRRITYLIDGDGRIAAVHEEMLGDASHVEAMLKALGRE